MLEVRVLLLSLKTLPNARHKAAADVLLLLAHTKTFAEPTRYATVIGDPVQVLAKELGNNVPRSVLTKYVSEQRAADVKSQRHAKVGEAAVAAAAGGAAQGESASVDGLSTPSTPPQRRGGAGADDDDDATTPCTSSPSSEAGANAQVDGTSSSDGVAILTPPASRVGSEAGVEESSWQEGSVNVKRQLKASSGSLSRASAMINAKASEKAAAAAVAGVAAGGGSGTSPGGPEIEMGASGSGSSDCDSESIGPSSEEDGAPAGAGSSAEGGDKRAVGRAVRNDEDAVAGERAAASAVCTVSAEAKAPKDKKRGGCNKRPKQQSKRSVLARSKPLSKSLGPKGDRFLKGHEVRRAARATRRCPVERNTGVLGQGLWAKARARSFDTSALCRTSKSLSFDVVELVSSWLG